MMTQLPSVDLLKKQARRLRERLKEAGQPVSHARSLELIAAQYGLHDWNTLVARAPAARPPEASATSDDNLGVLEGLVLGDPVAGTYLGMCFSGRICGVHARGKGFLRVTIVFDRPVNVSRFQSFAVERRRISATVSLATGKTLAKISDGNAQLALFRQAYTSPAKPDE